MCELSRAGPEKGGLDLSRRVGALKGGKTGTAIVPGSPDESLLVDKVVDGEMPPKGALAPRRLRRCEIGCGQGPPIQASP